MIVSILQLLGFPVAKPVHSRAEEVPPGKPPKSARGTADDTEHPQGRPARRQEVKSKSGNENKVKDTKAKAKMPAKPLVKPPPKAVKAAPAKAAVKPVSKPVAKPVAKPAAKSASKVPAKVLAKPPAKVAKKAVVKIDKTTKIPAAKSAPKTPAKPVPVTVAIKAKIQVQVTPPATKTVSPTVAATPAAVPAKAGRPSSRLAQLTVPSIAQTVASTAAKASYAQSKPSSVIVPVLPASVKKDPKLANNWKTTPAAQLTDAELMAMPDSEYMNEVQLAAFRFKLSALKRDILSNAGETTEHLREDTSVVPDPADRATIEEEHALELRTRDRERKLLKKIEQSIARIDAGDYGYCDETGEAIGVGRLLARPTATLSLEAQQRRELKQKMFGD
jgi:DnaK suppressor protein